MPLSSESLALVPPPKAELPFGARPYLLVFAPGREISGATLFLLLHWGGWIAFGAVPFAWSLKTWGLWVALLNNTLFVVSGALICLALRFAYRRARLRKTSYLILAPAVLLAVAILAEVWYLAELLVVWCVRELAQWFHLHPQFVFGGQELANSPLLIPLSLWFIYSFALLTWSSLYFGVNSIMALELERTQTAHALRLADSARLRVLQTQLSPHFLFNALNGVATLIRENKGPTAARMVSTLSDFLRATLHKFDIPEISVAEELVFIDHYIELQQLRFTGRFSVMMDVAEETSSALIPTLILQPLVENAVQHGVLSQKRVGTVGISIKKEKTFLCVTVEDDGPGPATTGPTILGVGLTNTSERLRALYGGEATMSIGRSNRGGFLIQLNLPFRERNKDRVMPTKAAETT